MERKQSALLLAGTGIAVFGVLIAFGTIIFPTTTNNLLATVIQSQSPTYQACVAELRSLYPETTKADWTEEAVELNEDASDDYIFKNTAEDSCGNGGCRFEICLVDDRNEVTVTPFGYAGESLTPLATISNGVRDLELEGQSTIVFSFDGSQYQLQ